MTERKTKSARLFEVFVLWALVLIVFAVFASIIDSDWPILVPLGGAFVHALVVAAGK